MSRVLEGRLAMVTGAADGIGRGIVELFVEEGARVVAVDIQEALMREAYAAVPAVSTIALDVTDADAPRRLRAFAEEKLGGLDILVNNAGIGGDFKHIAETSDENYRRVMAVNVEAPFRTTREMIPLLAKNKRGRIITTGSTCSHFAMTGLGVYTMSKHAVLGMMKAFAYELGPLGITSNNIEPGNTLTGITRPIFPSADSKAGRDYIDKTSVLGRYGLPEDLAGAALYLASDRASFVTGRSIAVDGGMMCALYATPL
jgi:NAD(P)-dependent dehydrogenase (short-subunit alcohol dehydrogenase family)